MGLGGKQVARFSTTNCGISRIGEIPWGSHLCHFYQTREDLVESLVPYFRAGLENNERCIWVTAAPFPAAEAIIELDRSMRGLDRHFDQGRIRIVDSDLWYTGLGRPTQDSVIDLWLREEKDAAVGGFTGLRVAGNLSFLKRGEMASFIEYERTVDRIFPKRQIIALCSYELKQCSSYNHSRIIQAHRYALERRRTHWKLTDSLRRSDSFQ
jgi:hypothetical protein